MDEKKWVRDTDFIKGAITVTRWWGAHPKNWGVLDPKINIPDFWCKVKNKDEERTYNAVTFLDYLLENYFEEIDKTSDLREKMSILNKARFVIRI